MSLTINAECFPLLGGMQDSDPAAFMTALTVMHDRLWWAWHPSANCCHNPLKNTDRLLVEQSAPVLLRVLARHLGWEGNERPVLRVERRFGNAALFWALRNLTKWHSPPDGVEIDGPNFYHRLPEHISTDLDYLEALAAAVVHYARLARALDEAGTAILPDGVTVADVEDEHGLPPLEVQR